MAVLGTCRRHLTALRHTCRCALVIVVVICLEVACIVQRRFTGACRAILTTPAFVAHIGLTALSALRFPLFSHLHTCNAHAAIGDTLPLLHCTIGHTWVLPTIRPLIGAPRPPWP